MINFKTSFILILFALISVYTPVCAFEDKVIGSVQEQINTNEIPNGISFTTSSEMKLDEGKIVIPKDAVIYAYVVGVQGEKRWHKSGFALCKLKGYKIKTENAQKKAPIVKDEPVQEQYETISLSPSLFHEEEPPVTQEEKQELQNKAEEVNNFVDISKQDIYMVARKYEAIDKKEAGKTAAELTATTAASFVIPGIDVAYYFAKGMINKQEGKTRFKSGVSTAYENSIFWFWLKGKPVDLEENAALDFKEIDRQKAHEMIAKMKEKDSKI